MISSHQNPEAIAGGARMLRRLQETAQASARAKGAKRFEGFMRTLGRQLATGDRFLKKIVAGYIAERLSGISTEEAAAATDSSLENPSG